MRDVAVVAFAESTSPKSNDNTVEMVMPVLDTVCSQVGIERSSYTFGFTCHGSSDYLSGQPFSFVMAVDALGAWPPIAESHVEMDAAWALYEAWVKLQMGEVDTALVFGYGKSSSSDVNRNLALQLDPYYVAPLWPDARSMAALQARLLVESGRRSERDMAEVAVRNRRNGGLGEESVDDLLSRPYVAEPLREHDTPPVTDGVSAVILAAGDAARSLQDRPAWIKGIDHRIDAQGLGYRDLRTSSSARIAGERAGVGADKVDAAELHAPYSSQELILLEALGLDVEKTSVNPSGGTLCSNPVMAAGLSRIGEAARRVWDGSADRAVATATSGPCLQQNLVCVLEGE